MVCKNCGTEGGNAKFCPNCGAPLFQPNEGMQNQQFQQPQPTMQFQPNTTPKRKNTIALFRETYHSVTSRFFSNNTCWKLIFAIHFISPTRLNKILFFYCIIMHYPV